MGDELYFLKIKNLYVNFYTKAGVVKALDGVDVEIKRGETFGLVGESGCGKSVTANSVMRIIPTPPGKIEGGRILVDLPADLQQKLADIEDEQTMGGNPEDIKKKMDEIATELNKYDILKMRTNRLLKIRGKVISMIFQEPMSALNPVFTIGDQITEIFLLHELPDLINGTIRKLDENYAALSSTGYTATKKIEEGGELKCSDCGSTVGGKSRKCPYCGGSFNKKGFKGFHLWRIKYYKKLYKMLLKDQYDVTLYFMNKVPILNRYRMPLRAEATGRAIRMLRLVRIPDPGTIVNNYPHELSGGMQQRVMIAMALSCKPKLLIADEPTTALDVTIQAQILKLMRELQEETGTSILMITHNLGVVAEICDRVGVMYAGNIVEIGSTDEIFAQPLHPYTQGLMNSIPKLTENVTHLEVIKGSVPNLLHPPPGCRFHPRCPFAMQICSEVKPVLQDIVKDHRVACHLYGEVKRNE
jgi:peptide/nickel transport system ATP-binding protein